MRKLYRANWRIMGLGGTHELRIGQTIELEEEEARPYIGNALSEVTRPPKRRNGEDKGTR